MEPKIELIDLQNLASGDTFQLKIYRFVGKQEGKRAYIQANLHGAEIVGNAVIYELLNYFSSLQPEDISGEIILVPLCNPTGVNQRHHFFSTGRFNPYDGQNWNRIFWDFSPKLYEDLDVFIEKNLDLSERELAAIYKEKIRELLEAKVRENGPERGLSFSEKYRNILQSLSVLADYVIDIHSSSVSAINYIYTFKGREKSAEYFGFEYGVLVDEMGGNAFDEAFLNPWLKLEEKLAEKGREIVFDVESWTLELGSGMKIEEESVEQGVTGIINYLAFKKMLNTRLLPVAKKIKLIPKSQMKHYYAPRGGIIRNRRPVGSIIKKGDTLYQLLSFEKRKTMPTITDIVSVDEGIVYDVSTNDTVNEGEYVLGIFTHDQQRGEHGF
ncbi:MAG: succinylglutamate desuccinylase/aspartoacylase family protein [Geminocystis sp.]|nr:succinylglutamate desuccinylase/aspartoacylase family protein [Geminocystis sp.]HIK38120.1 succinylglutamate desuccinylase/aspartoacylase family protein [Geminocystis sp. M7585_C2015_104]MCS7148148.1 succinylglutamate desuccinylase/aspartoacylase family protein [Geminocystis sp.]MCX8078101.1 succinylglutamate desuccinylase/aspartoacylase family protein [Geminocystis sp.]MDW8116499.1 succinylglutamate desuccinylase/aspartoacylase family protein [Geminocystis sp.]